MASRIGELAWDTVTSPELGEESGVTLIANKVSQAVVIRSAEGAVRHRPRVPRRGRWRKQTRSGERKRESSAISYVLRLRRDEW